MKKAQLSFEFLLYLAVAGLSLAFAVSVLGSGEAKANFYVNAYLLSNMAYRINYAMTAGMPEMTLKIALPEGLCNNSTITVSSLSAPYGTFGLVAPLKIDSGALCTSSGNTTLTIYDNHGSFMLAKA
ncbi:MAG: hypothetical protein QW774_02825 [Candidatus Micrarchaeaceae archaeon]